LRFIKAVLALAAVFVKQILEEVKPAVLRKGALRSTASAREGAGSSFHRAMRQVAPVIETVAGP
jgi:hypothetical protein